MVGASLRYVCGGEKKLIKTMKHFQHGEIVLTVLVKKQLIFHQKQNQHVNHIKKASGDIPYNVANLKKLYLTLFCLIKFLKMKNG